MQKSLLHRSTMVADSRFGALIEHIRNVVGQRGRGSAAGNQHTENISL